MAKRVLKNKRLMRTLLILAGFLIVGFFVWCALFKNTKILEGQQWKPDVSNRAASAASAASIIRDCKNVRTCITDRLNISNDDYDEAYRRTIQTIGTFAENITSIVLDKQTPPPPSTSPPPPPTEQPSALDMVTETVDKILEKCRDETNGVSPGFDNCITDALIKRGVTNFTLADADAAIDLKLKNKDTTTLKGNIISTVMTRLQEQQ